MGRGRFGVAGWLAFTALASLALAACSGDDAKPAPQATTAVVSPAETSPVETSPAATVLDPPVRPVDRPTEASAVEFIRYFWDTYNYAYSILDPSLLESVAEPSCTFCSSAVADARDIAAKGGHSEGGEIKLLDAVSESVNPQGVSVIDSWISQRPGTLSIPGSAPKVDQGFKRVPVDYALDWQGGRWVVRGVDAKVKQGQPWSN